MSAIDEIMTAKEVAAYLKLPEKTIHQLVTKGHLSTVEIGGKHRFKKSVLNRWLANQVKLLHDIELALAAPSAKPEVISISNFMREDAVSMRLTATTRDGVLRELVNLVPTISGRFRQILFNALKVRETLCSTAMGDGVAIPHARNAMVGLVSNQIIVFGRHTDGIDFGALDGKPTYLFFLLCAPNVRVHLQLLARLGRVLRHETVRDALREANKPSEVLRIIRDAETR